MIVRHPGFDYAFDPESCKECSGLCCKGEGYVFVSRDEMEKIAHFLGMDVERFEALYTRKALYGKRVTLATISCCGDKRCVFLDKNNRCEIYSVRPDQCRRFPFWDSLRKKSKEELCSVCKGILYEK